MATSSVEVNALFIDIQYFGIFDDGHKLIYPSRVDGLRVSAHQAEHDRYISGVALACFAKRTKELDLHAIKVAICKALGKSPSGFPWPQGV